MSTRFPKKPLIAALLVAMAAGGPAFATPVIQQETKVLPGRQITDDERAAITSSAVRVLRHIANARTALQGDTPDLKKAGDQLSQSTKLLDIIQTALPTRQVKERVWTTKNHLEYENSEEVAPDLVPIYGSIDELVDFVPAAKAADARAEPVAQEPQPVADQAASEPLEEVDDGLFYAEADLSLSNTRHLVQKAQSALAKEDAEAADAALQAAQADVVFVSVSYRVPLMQAKTALYRAGEEHEQGRNDLAKADLNRVVQYLERAAESSDQVTREAAADLVPQVRDLHAAIDASGKGFTAKFEGIWQRVKAVAERSAAELGSGWHRLGTQGAVKRDLIDAKLHLAYARIDHINSQDDAAARVDLAEAKGYLDAAAENLQADPKIEVTKLSDSVAALEQGLDNGVQKQADLPAFNRVETVLSTVIEQL